MLPIWSTPLFLCEELKLSEKIKYILGFSRSLLETPAAMALALGTWLELAKSIFPKGN